MKDSKTIDSYQFEVFMKDVKTGKQHHVTIDGTNPDPRDMFKPSFIEALEAMMNG